MMEKYFTLLDNRPEERNPDDDSVFNNVGIAVCGQHEYRLNQLIVEEPSVASFIDPSGHLTRNPLIKPND